MSRPVVITADSTCDLSPELKERYHIRTIPLTVNLGDESYRDGVDFTPDDLYRRFRADGTLPKTAAPSVQDFLDFFTPLTEQGYDVVHLDISAEFSGTFRAASIAAGELRGVYVVDSRSLSTGVGLLCIEAAECAERGMCAYEIADHLNALRDKLDVSFVLDTLEFMWKGGRCTGVTALGANLLQLKPGLEVKDGRLVVYKKYRGSIQSVYKKYFAERLSGKKIRPGHVFITESGDVDPAVVTELEALLRETVAVQEVHHTRAGCTVSSHCGPKTLGVLFINE